MISDVDLAPLPQGYRWKLRYKKMKTAQGRKRMYVLYLQRRTTLLGWYTVDKQKLYHDLSYSENLSARMKREELSRLRERELREKVTGVHYVPEED